jgi:ribose transport system permease protein
VGLSSFVVTLGMLSFARSLAVVMSQNQMIYQLGPGGVTFKALGGGAMLGIANPVWVLVVLTSSSALSSTSRHGAGTSYAIGGNENAARLTGVPVARVKLQAYVISGLTAALSAVLIVGWQGSAINALGTGTSCASLPRP